MSALTGAVDLPALRSAASSLRHPLARALLALTFTTGFVDAASYLGLGHVFAANMTGNIVLLGFGIAGTGGLPVVSPIVSLAAFLVGATGGGWIGVVAGSRRHLQLALSLAIEAAFLLAAALVAAFAHPRSGAFSGDAVIALLAFAMGVRNATVGVLNVPDMTTTVLTRTLTGLAAGTHIAGGTGAGNVRRIAAVVAMFGGALVGALLLKTSITLVLAVATALATATLLAYALVVGRRPAPSED